MRSTMDFESTYRARLEAARRLDDLQTLFVVGCAKSGTTWLQHLLDGHPEMVVNGEGRFFWHLDPPLRQAILQFNEGKRNQEHVSVLREQDYLALLRWTIDGQLHRYLEEAGAGPEVRVVGDKTPMHAVALPQIDAIYPRAKFIHIVRDPRDATNSQWHFWAKEHDPRPLEEFVRFSITQVWPLNVTAARKAGAGLGADRYLEVRYEDLHRDERGELGRMLRFLGLDDGADAIDACVAAGRFERHAGGRARGTAQEGHLFRKGVVGDWRHHLPTEIVAAACAEIGPIMKLFGYAPEVVAATTGAAQ